MARAALDWTIPHLAKRAGVGYSTVARFEKVQGTPISATLGAIRRALEDAGIDFIDGADGKGPGVRLKGATSQL